MMILQDVKEPIAMVVMKEGSKLEKGSMESELESIANNWTWDFVKTSYKKVIGMMWDLHLPNKFKYV